MNSELQTKLEKKFDQLRALRKAKTNEVQLRKSIMQETNDCETALEVVQKVAAAVQDDAHSQVATIVSKCLSAIFPKPYTFKINFERKRGKTEAELKFIRNGMELDPKDSSGGSTIDVAAFALRLSCIMLSRTFVRRLIVLDEPFRFVEPANCRRVRDLLLSLADEFGIQIIQTTHSPDLIAGNVIELK